MTTVTDFTLEGADGEPLRGASHVPAAPPRAALLIAHGFKGYKEYGFIPRLAEAAADHGLLAHRFDFSHNGIATDPATFERPDLFEADTFGKQIADLDRVARAQSEGRLPGNSAERPQVWFGHSRGGVTALLTAARRALGELAGPEPAGVVTAAAPAHACNLDDEQRRELRENGSLATPSSRTGQMLRIGRAWLEEIEADPDRFDPVRAAGQITRPLIAIHGDGDDTVPPEAADRLAAAASAGRSHHIPDAGHTFNARNPLPEDDPLPRATATLFELVWRIA